MTDAALAELSNLFVCFVCFLFSEGDVQGDVMLAICDADFAYDEMEAWDPEQAFEVAASGVPEDILSNMRAALAWAGHDEHAEARLEQLADDSISIEVPGCVAAPMGIVEDFTLQFETQRPELSLRKGKVFLANAQPPQPIELGRTDSMGVTSEYFKAVCLKHKGSDCKMFLKFIYGASKCELALHNWLLIGYSNESMGPDEHIELGKQARTALEEKWHISPGGSSSNATPARVLH